MVEKSVAEIDFAALTNRSYYPSPAAWEDQVLYFLMLDRFSNGMEQGYRDNDGQTVAGGTTPVFNPSDANSAATSAADWQSYLAAGHRFVGGTLQGLETKLGYLQRLGITAIWLSPILKQVPYLESYHGYGVQNFLDVDPRFGTRDDLAQFVASAHQLGLRVILDVVLNHSGDVFEYDPDRYIVEASAESGGHSYFDPRWDGGHYAVKGYRDATGTSNIPFHAPVDPSHFPDGAIWPSELQHPSTFTAKGRIEDWEHDPEFLEGDFYSLKDIHLGSGHVDHFEPSSALRALCECYKYWIAFADLDGFRVDTVKHMDTGATRLFTSVIKEFTQSIGKENFCLIGEITGGRSRAFTTLATTGLDAALGIDDIPDRIEYLVKGYRNPEDYFSLFRNSLLVQKDSHTWFRNKIVTTFDDHDQVRKRSNKSRFCNREELPWDPTPMVLLAMGMMSTTLGIPCIYYGTEQGFDGHGNDDCFLREAMFGGEFGAFRSKHRHFFREEHPIYQELSKILAVRKASKTLRRGRQYLRPISGDGVNFGNPRTFGGEIRSVVPWSRIFVDRETVVAMNTDPFNSRASWVTLDNELHREGDTLTCLYSTDHLRIGQTAAVATKNGKAFYLALPAAGFEIWE